MTCTERPSPSHPPQAHQGTALTAHDQLSFDSPLQPADVHKAAAAEVFLTDARRLGDNRFAVAALWPRDAFLTHRATSEPCDPLLVVETVRQSAIHLSHAFHDVPMGHHFVLSALDFDLEPPVWTPGPLPVVLDISCTRTNPNPRRFAMALHAEVYIAGVRRGHAGLRFEVLSPQRYAMIRGRTARSQAEGAGPVAPTTAARPLPPEAVGFRDDLHVLLATAPDQPDGTWLLRLRGDHPVLFDHASDHISGMALLEACRQAATAVDPPPESAGTPRRTLTCATATYETFGELDSPVTLSAWPAAHPRSLPRGAQVLQLTARQGNRTLITATVAAASGSPASDHTRAAS